MKSVRFLKTLNFVLILLAICCFSTNSYSGILDDIKKSIEDTTGNSKKDVKKVKESEIEKTSFKSNTTIEPIDDGGIKAYGLSWNSTFEQTKQHLENSDFYVKKPRYPSGPGPRIYLDFLYKDVTGYKPLVNVSDLIWLFAKPKKKGDFIKRIYYGFSKTKKEMIACMVYHNSKTGNIKSLEKYGKPRKVKEGKVAGFIYPHKADVVIASLKSRYRTAILYFCISRLKEVNSVLIEKKRAAEAKELENEKKRSNNF